VKTEVLEKVGFAERDGFGFVGFQPIEKAMYEHFHHDNPNAGSNTYGVNWDGQTFTPVISHKITSVKLHLYKEWGATSIGIVTASIRATDVNGLPTGGDLTSGIFNGDSIPEDPNAAWIEIPLVLYQLNANTKYAIVFRAPSAMGPVSWGGSGYINWDARINDATYAGGATVRSTDSGATWLTGGQQPSDYLFEEWGA